MEWLISYQYENLMTILKFIFIEIRLMGIKIVKNLKKNKKCEEPKRVFTSYLINFLHQNASFHVLTTHKKKFSLSLD